MSQLKYWLWLAAQTNVSAHSKAALIAHYGDAEAAYAAPNGEFSKIHGVSERDAAFMERRDLSGLDRIFSECEAQNIRMVAINDAEYPQRLKNTFSPPPLLFVKGHMPNVDDSPAVAVIGTRRASPYGLKMGRKLAYEVVKCGGLVISMLTGGVDESAARGALLAGGCCIGVMGTPHSSQDSELYRDIAAGGALISEYPPKSKAMRSFFRDRNRIAAGLSAGVVVVEAPSGSGTLLFTAEAQEQGREIFAVPGNADSENSVGTIALLKQGAKPVTCGWDVMEEFKAMFPGKVSDAVSAPCPAEKESQTTKAEISKPVSAKKVIDNKNDTGYIDLTKQLTDLSGEQLSLIAAIDRGGSHIDDIIENTGLPTAKVLSQLTILEIKGYVRRESGRRIVLNTAKK